MAGKTPPQFIETLQQLSQILKGRKYAFRGTTSLILQKLDMVALDIDIICDKETALACNYLLADYLIEQVAYKKSPQFKSFFGKFKIRQSPVEVYGEWQIKDSKGNWSQIFSADSRIQAIYQQHNFWVTPIDEEFEVYALMGRWNAFHKIKRLLNQQTKTTGQTSFL